MLRPPQAALFLKQMNAVKILTNRMYKLIHWSDYSKQVGGQFIRIHLKIAKKCWLFLDNFSCVKINVFRSFFAFRLEMHVKCDNQYKTGADRENILGQSMLFECMGICVFSPAHESEMRGYFVYVLIVRYLSYRFCLNSATVY